MAYFIHRERYISDPIPSKSIIKFPTSVSESSNPASFRTIDPYDKMEDEEFWEKVPKTDIAYNGCNLPASQIVDPGCGYGAFEGAFDLYLPGTYILTWFISQITGLAPDSKFLCLKHYDYETNQWIAGGSSRLLVSASESSATIHVTQEQIQRFGKVTIALFNESNTPLLMNRTPHTKAALAIYGFSVISDEMLDSIRERLMDMEDECCNNDHSLLKCLKKQIPKLESIDQDQFTLITQLDIDWQKFYERFQEHSISRQKITVASRADQFPGLTLCYNRTGYLYVFWLEGTITPQITKNGKQYIVTSSQCEPLRLFNRTDSAGNPLPLRGVCYLEYGTTTSWIPVFFDNTGIYLNFTYATTINLGTRFSFSQVILLAEDM